MKQPLLITGLALLMNLSLLGQGFISPDKVWNVRLIIDLYTVRTEIFKIEGDSLVNSYTYNKIWISNDSSTSWTFQGLLREESNTVYFMSSNVNEGILYDFNLEIGDTAYVNNVFCNDIPIYVIDIDTVEYFGVHRKRWHLGENGNVEEFWVEGIGSINGPLYTKYWECMICPVWELLCYHDNDTLEYIMHGETECYINTVGINENNRENDFSINPNPVRKGNNIYVESASKLSSINLFNSSGFLIKSMNQFSDNKISIETNTLKSGLYFITIVSAGNKMKTRKILIE